MAFLVDPREHGVNELMKKELARFQGPALVAWNNAKFEKEDWKNIGRLDQSSKEAEVLKVGRFGIGFQSVHHITGGQLWCICIGYGWGMNIVGCYLGSVRQPDQTVRQYHN